jgi:hypothetical protein
MMRRIPINPNTVAVVICYFRFGFINFCPDKPLFASRLWNSKLYYLARVLVSLFLASSHIPATATADFPPQNLLKSMI